MVNMRNVLFLLLIVISLKVQAQADREQELTNWSIGLRAGGSLLPDFEDQQQKNFKLGFNGGVNTSYKLNKHFNLKLEVNFAQKGKSYSYDEKDNLFTSFNDLIGLIIDTSIIGSVQGFVDDGVYSTYNGYHRLGYVEVPLSAEINYYKFKLTAGPYLGILLNSYTKESLDQDIPLLDIVSPLIDSLGIGAFFVNSIINTSFPGYRETFVSESTSKTSFTQFNYGALIQLSYQMYENTFLEARYSRGLNSYLKDESDNIQLSSFTLSLAYNFGIKKLKK
jgi:hypothetical protein